MITPIQKAIEAAGGQAAMARLLSVHPAMVSQWATGRRPVAARHILPIEAATLISRHLLRPDVFGDAPSVDTGVTKRALRARLALFTDGHLAKVLGLPVEQVEAWAEDENVPGLPVVLQLLGAEPAPLHPKAPEDPDADRIIPVEAA